MPQTFTFELLDNEEIDALTHQELLDYLAKLRHYDEQLQHYGQVGDYCLQKLRERAEILQFQLNENTSNIIDGYWNYFKFALTKIH